MSTTGAVVLLSLTGLFLVAAIVLSLRSLLRSSALDGFAALCAVMVAGIPAVAYGGMAA